MLNLRSVLSGFFIFLIIAVPIASAQAQQQMLPAMADELTQYPGSTVEVSTQVPGGNLLTNLNCGKATPEEVAAYYKAKLTEKGYMITAVSGSSGFVGIKGETQVMVNFESENGNTVVSLAMIGGGADTTTSGMPSTPGTMPQMPMSPQAAPTAPAMPTMPMAPAAPAMPGAATAPGTGQAQYPEALKDIVAQYPNSMMMAGHETEEETAAVMTVGDPAEKVMEYYQSALSKAGWTKTNDFNVQGNIVAEYEKGDQLMVVTVQNASGMMMVTVALAKKS